MLDILQDGPGWAVVNKPAGIATERHYNYDTVEARALEKWQRPGASKPPYVGIVHRLDRVTSGALVLARNKSTLVKLNESFARGRTEKVYRAVSASPLPEEHGRLRHYLIRTAQGKSATASLRPLPGAKEAVLTYRLLETGNFGYAYQVELLTGRFHQIRAQFAACGSPLIGDVAYGSERLLGDYKIALHAYRLRFPNPASEETVESVAPLPDYWPAGT